MERGPEGLCSCRFCSVVLLISLANTKNTPVCRGKYGKSSVNVRNLPNDSGKKEDRVPASSVGAQIVGGLGSGSYYRSGSRDRVEDCLSLDVRSWRRDGWLEIGTDFITTWRRYLRDSSIGVRVLGLDGAERAHAVELYYSRGPEGRKEDVSYAVPLCWTPCNFGGSRAWFVCPGIVNGVACSRRVAKLYLKGRYFLCRHCHNLAYLSQQEAHRHAALRRCQRIRQKLGANANMTEPFPGKPKGMHFKTYLRLRGKYEKAYEEYSGEMVGYLERLTEGMNEGHSERS
jgi:hypothetical protein